MSSSGASFDHAYVVDLHTVEWDCDYPRTGLLAVP